MESQFTYNVLDKTQDGLLVLLLNPRASGPDISCQLEWRSFASKPVYEAVSYARGQESLEHKEITINGKQFRVPQNVYDILDDFRASEAPRSLWIDAVCINQADVQERNHQTGLMYLIFSRSQRVLVSICHPLNPITEPVDRESFRKWGKNAASIEEAGKSPYWKELWAVQDLAFARELVLYIGSYPFTASEFNDTIMYNDSTVTELSEAFLKMKLEQLQYDNNDDMRLRAGDMTNPLEVLIKRTKNLRCCDARDRIFALLSLATDWSDDIIQVDYGMSFCDLYIKTLQFHQTRPYQIERNFYSSWPKSLDRQLRLVGFSQRVQDLFAGRVEEEAAETEEARNPLTTQETIYHVRCGLAGEISFLGPTHKQCISSFRATTKWKKDLDSHYRDNKQELSEARVADEQYERILQDWDESYVRKLRSIHSTTSYGYQKSADDALLTIEADQPDQDQPTSGPKRFLGTQGLTGFVPAEAKVGDKVYTFWDCDVAVVLRNVAEDRWMIVGRADVAPVDRGRRDEYSIWSHAMMQEQGKQGDYVVGAGQRSDAWMMNLRLDVMTLQKLTC